MENNSRQPTMREALYEYHGIHPAQATVAPGRRKALVVGFEKYGSIMKAVATYQGVAMERKNKDLPASTNDAVAIASKLMHNARGANFEVTLMVDSDTESPNTIPGTTPIHADGKDWRRPFKEQLDRLFEGSTADDIRLFYFSGHGAIHDGKPSLVIPIDPDEPRWGFYPLHKLLTLISEHSFRHCILILDSCFGGDISRLINSQQFQGLKSGVTILTAGQEGLMVSPVSEDIEIGKIQKDWEVTGQDPTIPHRATPREGFPDAKDIDKPASERKHQDVRTNYSFFTGYLIEALVGGAADPLGVVTTLSAYQYVSEAMGFNDRCYTHPSDGSDPKKRPLLITNTDEPVVLKIIKTYLKEQDLKFLHQRFTNPNWWDAFWAGNNAVKKDKILAAKDVQGKKSHETTIRKLLQLGLIEYIEGSGLLSDYYRLTGRGKHYRDMVEHLHTLQLPPEERQPLPLLPPNIPDTDMNTSSLTLGRRLALIVGHGSEPAIASANKMVELLGHNMRGFNFEITTMIGRRPYDPLKRKLEAVEDALQEICKTTNENDHILVYLCLRESIGNLSVRNIIEQLSGDHKPLKNLLLILDCDQQFDLSCDQFRSLREGVVLLSMCGHDPKAISRNGKYTYFTGLLVEALKGGAADTHGIITVNNIFTYLQEATFFSPQIHPQIRSLASDSMIIRRVEGILTDAEMEIFMSAFPGKEAEDSRYIVYIDEIKEKYPAFEAMMQRFIDLQLVEGCYRLVTESEADPPHKAESHISFGRNLLVFLGLADAPATKKLPGDSEADRKLRKGLCLSPYGKHLKDMYDKYYFKYMQ